MASVSRHRKRPVIATVMKLEAPNIVEWIAWHRLQGFDVMVADNCSEGVQTRLLQKLRSAGLIHYVDARHLLERPQMPALSLLFEAAKKEGYEIFGFMDVDEFFEPLEGMPHGGAAVVERLLSKPMAWAVSFRWCMFGSGHQTGGPGLVVERFAMRGHQDHPSNRYVKSFVNIKRLGAVLAWRRADQFITPHTFPIPKQLYLRDGRRGSRQILDAPNGPWRIARIRHYAVKSAEEFATKRGRGDVFYRNLAEEDAYLEKFDLNDVHDPLPGDQITALKQEIGRIEEALGQVAPSA